MAIKIGIAGARGLSVIEALRDAPDAECVALCDIDAELLAAKGKEYGIPKTYRVYEDMLAADIDAVIVATPMQLHVQQSIQALCAGKHVLSEVTAGVSMDELFWLVEEVEKSGRTYMLAENYLYTPQAQQVLAMARAGLFGEPYYGEGEYLHELGDIMTYPSGAPSWRRWWQWGTRGLFYPTHSLGPVMKWFGEERIDFVVALGSGWHVQRAYRQEDTSVALLQLRSGKLIRLRVDCVSPRPHAMGNYSLQGSKGVFETRQPGNGEGRVALQGAEWRPLSDFAEYLPERYRALSERGATAGHGGGDYFIVQDFLDAVQGKKPPAIDVYEACEWTAVGLLSALSVSNRGRAMDMPDFRSGKREDKKLPL